MKVCKAKDVPGLSNGRGSEKSWRIEEKDYKCETDVSNKQG